MNNSGPSLFDSMSTILFYALPIYLLISIIILFFVKKRNSGKKLFLNSFISALIPVSIGILILLIFVPPTNQFFQYLGLLLIFALVVSLIISGILVLLQKLFKAPKKIKYTIIGVIILAYVFFFPKKANNYSAVLNQTRDFKACECVGILGSQCYGIPHSCKSVTDVEACGSKGCFFIDVESPFK